MITWLRVARHQSKCYQRYCTTPTFKFGCQTVNVWGGVASHRRAPMIWIAGSFNQHTYRSIICIHIIPFMNQKHDVSASFILQEDNCGPQRSRSIAAYLLNKTSNTYGSALPKSRFKLPLRSMGTSKNVLTKANKLY